MAISRVYIYLKHGDNFILLQGMFTRIMLVILRNKLGFSQVRGDYKLFLDFLKFILYKVNPICATELGPREEPSNIWITYEFDSWADHGMRCRSNSKIGDTGVDKPTVVVTCIVTKINQRRHLVVQRQFRTNSETNRLSGASACVQ
jgi:hypothetical protein